MASPESESTNFCEKIAEMDQKYLPIAKTNRMLYRLNTDHKLAYTGLLPKQVDAVRAALLGDVLVILPTGYGKSLIYQLLPYLSDPPRPVVVASPLNAIIEEQCGRLSAMSVTIDVSLLEGLKMGSSDSLSPEVRQTITNVQENKYLYLIGHPEQLVEPAFKNALATLTPPPGFLVVDEAHCVLSWGMSQFRPAFMDLQSLRCFMPGAKTIAMTATASSDNQQEIAKQLHMSMPKTVHLPPDRSKIFLNILRRPATAGGDHTVEASYESVLLPLIEELVTKQTDFPKTVVYIPIQWCAYAHTLACRILGMDLDQPDQIIDGHLDSLVAQYHAPQGKQMKNLIAHSMQASGSKLRMLFATEAYGMGADSPDIRRVIHIGPPNTVETYVQEIGRAGRDGDAAKASLYFNASDLGKNKTHMSESMRSFCGLTTCRRAFITEYFGGQYATVVSPIHKCCDNCVKVCDCDECIITADLKQTEEEIASPPSLAHGHLPETARREAEDLLLQYFEAENACVSGQLLPEAVTGLSVQLAKCLSSDPVKYLDSRTLAELFDIDLEFTENIFTILQCVVSNYI